MEGKPGDTTEHVLLLPSTTGKDRSGSDDQPGMSMKWALLWDDPAGFQMKQCEERAEGCSHVCCQSRLEKQA